MAKVSNWDKFTLLLWKNWTLQWQNKWQIVIELLLPVIFSMLLVLVRTLVVAEPVGVTEYDYQNISNLELFKSTAPSALRVRSLRRMFMNNASKTIGLESKLKFPQFQLLYSPKNDYLDDIIKDAAKSLDLVGYRAYSNASELESALILGNYIAGVQFDDSLANLDDYPDKFHFALRFPSELRTSTYTFDLTWYTMRLAYTVQLPGPRNPKSQDGGIPCGYLREGFIPIQSALSNSFLKFKSNGTEFPAVGMQRFPYPEYIDDPLLEGLGSLMALILLLSFIYPSTSITKYITTEKEKQLKEVMKIMGLNNWIHWTAWFVKSFLMLAFSAILMVLLLKIKWSDDVAVLTHSSWTALYFFLLVYVMTTIFFCFMLAVFFSRASTAAAVTGLLWFVAYIPYSFTFYTYNELSLGDKLGWSLISNTAMGFAVKLILGFEGTGEGLQWSNMFQTVTVDDNLTVGYVIIVMLVSCVLYMSICLYVEQIFPGDFGVAKKWYFPFTASFWCGENVYSVEDVPKNSVHRHNPEAFEVEPTGKHIGVQVKNLKKRFGEKLAVKDLSVNMYEDEITVLLGHNGAGKTTTISMLTGMFPPTSGTAIINGSDIRTNLEGARLSLGICPQHNVLFDDMSVANHLRFFSRMKGLKGDAIKVEVAKYLKMIELEDKADVASKKLSGGMKRKLSVCCALCGNTKVVLCDEPSSGMDPAARRQLWDLLQAEKVGRTLLLTTHFMDEADVLGDRIAIMCGGELKCHGTSFFLKKKYGSGYRLICVKQDNCNVDEVTALLNDYMPGIKPESDIGTELTYQLPEEYVSRFEAAFKKLETHSQELNLNGYGIGITSMEEVFMKVGAEDMNGYSRSESNGIKNGKTRLPEDDIESVSSDKLFLENANLLQGTDLIMNQWNAMLVKKILYTYRNKLMFFVQNFMPVFFVVVTILVSKNQGIFQELKPITISLLQYPKAVSVLAVDPAVQSGSLEERIGQQYQILANSYGEEYEFESTNGKSFTDYILKLGETIQIRINSRYLAAATISPGNITAWLNNQPLHTAPLTVNMVYNAIAKALNIPNVDISVTNAPLPYTTATILSQLSNGNNLGSQLATNLCFCFCFVSSFYILFLIKERESRAKLLQFVGGVRVWTYWLTQFIWDMITFIITALLVVITLVCFQEQGFSTFTELSRYFLIFVMFAFAAIPLTYLFSLVFTEPATGFARISIVNIFTGEALFIVIAVMSLELFDTKPTAELLSWIFRLFPHFSLAMGLNKAYVNVAKRNACNNQMLSLLPDYLRCQLIPQCCNDTPFFAWEEPGILPETVYMISVGVIIFAVLIIREYGLINELIYKIKSKSFSPPPPPEDGYFDDDVDNEKKRIMNMSAEQISDQNLVLDQVTKYYDKFLAVNQISLCVKQKECFGLLGVNGAGKTTTFKMMTGDERISSGSAYIKGMNLKSDMNNIYKEIGYCPQFDALLDDLTGREVLRIFCLLRGVRRSRIRQVSEELAVAFGFLKHIDKQTKVYSGGNKRKLSTAIAVIGNPSVVFLDEPTTGMDPAARRQLWNLVCRIRDSGKSIILTSHSMEECEALCTRLAIMVNGDFKCIGSTQHLKNKFSKGLILKIKVLQNIEQSRRLSILDFSIQNQSNHDDINKVKEFVKLQFSEAILQEEYQGILTFYIPLSSISGQWSLIFGLMEGNRDRLNIEDYSISQTTLEEIFLDFAKYQREDPRAMK